MRHILSLVLLVLLPVVSFSQTIQKVDFEEILLQGIASGVTVQFDAPLAVSADIVVNGEVFSVPAGVDSVAYSFTPGKDPVVLEYQDMRYPAPCRPIPLFWSILPPLIAIVLALLLKEVLSALFAGIFSGCAIIGFYKGGLVGIFSGFLSTIDTYIIEALQDSGHLSVILFSMIIGAVVHLISQNGGMNTIVAWLSKRARTARSGQMATYVMGIMIFFDDYANTLVVGNTMRPITDRLRISREKLAYIVDSTAAPVAAIAFVTTWIGAELGYIGEAMEKSGQASFLEGQSAYGLFFQSLPYSFYPLLTLFFIFLLIRSQRDFGPMHRIETHARSQPAGVEKSEKELPMASAWAAILPVAVIILGTLGGLLYTGYDAGIWENTQGFWRKVSGTIGNADSYVALLWSSISALMVAVVMSVTVARMKFTRVMESGMEGFKTMLPAIVILILSWALAGVTENMHTADFLTGVVGDRIHPGLFPAITFVLAAVVAFSTGSSWGTMAILYPLVLPALTTVCIQAGLADDYALSLFLNATACVLAGSVLGDHCSPISDTTILSSLASSCDHVSHVRTQLPYALTVGGTALLLGTLPAGLGVSPWIMLPLAGIIIYLVIRFFGNKVPDAA